MKAKFAIRSACVGLMMLACASPALAQSGDPLQRLAQADTNNDGAISWSEVTTLRTETFNRLDRNQDGYIAASDRPRGPFGARFDEAFVQVQAQFDANSDQRVSRAEMANAPAPLFEQGDANGDKVLSASELSALRASAAAAQ